MTANIYTSIELLFLFLLFLISLTNPYANNNPPTKKNTSTANIAAIMNKKNGFVNVFGYIEEAIFSEPLIVRLITCPKTTQIIDIERIPFRTFNGEYGW